MCEQIRSRKDREQQKKRDDEWVQSNNHKKKERRKTKPSDAAWIVLLRDVDWIGLVREPVTTDRNTSERLPSLDSEAAHRSTKAKRKKKGKKKNGSRSRKEPALFGEKNEPGNQFIVVNLPSHPTPFSSPPLVENSLFSTTPTRKEPLCFLPLEIKKHYFFYLLCIPARTSTTTGPRFGINVARHPWYQTNIIRQILAKLFNSHETMWCDVGEQISNTQPRAFKTTCQVNVIIHALLIF